MKAEGIRGARIEEEIGEGKLRREEGSNGYVDKKEWKKNMSRSNMDLAKERKG